MKALTTAFTALACVLVVTCWGLVLRQTKANRRDGDGSAVVDASIADVDRGAGGYVRREEIAESTCRVVLLVEASDGTPVADVPVTLATVPDRVAAEKRTDADGVAAWRIAAPGRVRYACCGVRGEVVLRVGGEVRRTIRLPGAVRPLVVEVRDRHGNPAGAARVICAVLDEGRQVGDPRCLGSTGADGRLSVVLENREHGIWATRIRRRGSASRSHVRQVGDERHLRLRLDLECAVLAGTVRDASGPVAGVSVELGSAVGWPFSRVGGVRVAAQYVEGARTDDAGRYELRGLFPGRLPMQVHGADYLPWRHDVILEPGANRRDVVLDGGVRLEGRVAHAGGVPTSAEVRLTSAAGFDRRVSVDGAGRYSMRIPADGQLRVEALDPDVGRDRTVLRRDRHAVTEWNAELAPFVEFTVVGAPESVVACRMRDWMAWGRTRLELEPVSSSGERRLFRIGGPSEVEIHAFTADEDRRAWYHDTVPIRGGEEIVLPRYDEREICTLTGTLVDTGGWPMAGVALLSYVPGESRSVVRTDENGRFTADGLRAGARRVEAIAPSYRGRVAEVTLAPGQTADLGVIRLPVRRAVVEVFDRRGSERWLEARIEERIEERIEQDAAGGRVSRRGHGRGRAVLRGVSTGVVTVVPERRSGLFFAPRDITVPDDGPADAPWIRVGIDGIPAVPATWSIDAPGIPADRIEVRWPAGDLRLANLRRSGPGRAFQGDGPVLSGTHTVELRWRRGSRRVEVDGDAIAAGVLSIEVR